MSPKTIPYNSLFIDADSSVFFSALKNCFRPSDGTPSEKLRNLFQEKSGYALPTLSTRTGLDLFLSAKSFPVGSDIVMSAINIPDMAKVIQLHGLNIVTCDLNLDTLGVDVASLEKAITPNTVALLVSHLYGTWFDMNPIIEMAQEHNLVVIEDCAEAFCGFSNLGHDESDITLYSFGAIKYLTAFGGGVAKLKLKDDYDQMIDLYNRLPVQSSFEYGKKVMKYYLMYLMINKTWWAYLYYVFSTMNFFVGDYRTFIVGYLRGFPNLLNIRKQPSSALLLSLAERLTKVNIRDTLLRREKGEYFSSRLRHIKGIYQPGHMAAVNNHWLFPILVKDVLGTVEKLNAEGIQAYRGFTQLSLINPTKPCPKSKNAELLMKHVIYLPVHKIVPFPVLDEIIDRLQKVLNQDAWSPHSDIERSFNYNYNYYNKL